MKRLISQEEVLKNKDSKEPILIDKNTIITPAAKDLAKDLGIEVKYCECIQSHCTHKESESKDSSPDCEEKKDCECKTECKTECKEKAISEDEIYALLKKGIDNHLLSVEDLEKLIKK